MGVIRRCHLCGRPTVDKYCDNEECEVFIRDEKINKKRKNGSNNNKTEGY